MAGNSKEGEGVDAPFSLGFEGEYWVKAPESALVVPLSDEVVIVVWKHYSRTKLVWEVLTDKEEYQAEDILMAAAIVANLKEKLNEQPSKEVEEASSGRRRRDVRR